MKKIHKKLHIFKESKKIQSRDKGFIILFAMLISALILLISSGIYNVVQKQVVLSSYARESQKAFYAADAALDCALFNDISPLIIQTAFPLSSVSGDSVVLTCGGEMINGGGTTTSYFLDAAFTGSVDYTHSFVFRYYGPQYFDSNNNDSIDIADEYVGSGCAYVLVEKKQLASLDVETRITASGFNTCTDSITTDQYDVPDFYDPKLLERRLSVSYTI